MDEIYKKMTEIFRDVFDDDTLVVTPDMTADDVAEWDSLNHIRLILTVQKAFEVKFSAAPFEMAWDPANKILYAASWEEGLLAIPLK